MFKQTARAFISLLKNLRKTILQDAATLMLESRTHALFDLPVFKCADFLVYKESMRAHLAKFKDTDPMEADWNRLVPGLREQMSKTISAVDSGFNQLNTKIESFVTKDYINQLITTLGSNILQSIPPANVGASTSTQSPSVQNDGDGDPNFSTYRVPSKFPSVTAMHTEWVTSVHHFQIGGQSTRKHWSDSEKKRYSRIKKVIDIVSGLEAQHNSIPLATILLQLDYIFKTRCNGAISTFISWSSKNAIQIALPHTTCPANIPPQHTAGV